MKKRGNIILVGEKALDAVEQNSYNDSHTNISIEEAISQLTEEHREAIVLHDIQGYRYDEMAEMLGIPQNLVVLWKHFLK